MKKYVFKRGELAKKILLLVAGTTLFTAALVLPGLTHAFALFIPKNAKGRYRIKRTLQTLQNQRLVKIYYKGAREIIEITEKGKKRILEYKLDELKVQRPKKWDRLWRLVIFDIPEQMKDIRGEINFRLTDMGFLPFQKSVFVCPYPCKKEIDFLGEHFYVRKYIKYVLAKYIDDDELFKEKFELA